MNNDEIDVHDPIGTDVKRNYRVSTHKSVNTLRRLGFDPIRKLVRRHEEIEEEVVYQRKLRSGEVVELTSSGKPRAFRAEILLALYQQLINIEKELLVYGYSKVPNDDNEKPALPPMVMNLHKTNQTFLVNLNNQQEVEDV